MDNENRIPLQNFHRMVSGQMPSGFKVVCNICDDKISFDQLQIFPCRHVHCNDCIKANAQSSLQSTPFRPAKCCEVISIEVLQQSGALTQDEAATYRNKIEELTNPSTKLYCHKSDCNQYIPVVNQKKRIGVCEGCGARTCKTCHGKSHFGACDKEQMLAANTTESLVFKLAETKGWKRCPGCLNLVQKQGGCNHMVCSCGQSFCYGCGQALSPMDHVAHQCAVLNV